MESPAHRLAGDRRGHSASRLPSLTKIVFWLTFTSLSGLAAWAKLGPFLLSPAALDRGIQEATASDRLYEAERLLDHASGAQVLETPRLDEHRSALDSKYSLPSRGWRALKGFVTGTGESAEAIGAGLIGDLTVWGDIRDFGIQQWHRARGEDVDEIVEICAGLGLLATAAPHLDVALSILKRCAKYMSTKLAASLLDLARLARKERKVDRLASVLSDLGTVARREPGAMPVIFKLAETPDELASLSKVVVEQGRPAVNRLFVMGRLGVRAVRSTYKRLWDILFLLMAFLARLVPAELAVFILLVSGLLAWIIPAVPGLLLGLIAGPFAMLLALVRRLRRKNATG
jgi:hypothetical protein